MHTDRHDKSNSRFKLLIKKVSKIFQITNFMRIRPFRAEVVHAHHRHDKSISPNQLLLKHFNEKFLKIKFRDIPISTSLHLTQV